LNYYFVFFYAANNLLPPVLKTSSSSSKRGRSASNDDTPDVQALKRHIMIRNRESASLSKKKKKDYVTGLESRIHDLEKESDGLKKENSFLRSKLQQLGAKV
jgi:ribosomal protein L35